MTCDFSLHPLGVQRLASVSTAAVREVVPRSRTDTLALGALVVGTHDEHRDLLRAQDAFGRAADEEVREPRRPCVPMTIKLALRAAGAARIASTGRPSTIAYAASMPRACASSVALSSKSAASARIWATRGRGSYPQVGGFAVEVARGST